MKKVKRIIKTGLNKHDASTALRNGNMVSHTTFSEIEYIKKFNQFQYQDQSGNTIPIYEFWRFRSSEIFDEGWSVVKIEEVKESPLFTDGFPNGLINKPFLRIMKFKKSGKWYETNYVDLSNHSHRELLEAINNNEGEKYLNKLIPTLNRFRNNYLIEAFNVEGFYTYLITE